MTWGLLITEPAARHLRKLPRHDLEHVDAALDEMRVNPYSGDIKFLRGASGALRRRRLQVRRVIHMKLLKRRSILPVRRLLVATTSSSVLISAMSRSFVFVRPAPQAD
jgi:mRNA-degrading endonuclease RelE of RelBE toxin-antitoxin system